MTIRPRDMLCIAGTNCRWCWPLQGTNDGAIPGLRSGSQLTVIKGRWTDRDAKPRRAIKVATAYRASNL